MTPEELAARHPKLYHITEPGAWSSIKEKGLLSTTHLLNIFEVENSLRFKMETKPRPSSITLEHPLYGNVIINDNVPLHEKALAKCLDDNLTPADWICILNARVFFWANEESLNRHLGARLNRQRSREIIVLNTLSLAKAHSERIELCPINSGVTFRKAARRGLNTFTPMLQYGYQEWSKLRGGRDRILEITVLDHVLDIACHTIEVMQTDNKI